MKGVVLSGGRGSRLRPLTYSMAKQLVPVANQPVLFFGLRDLASAGIEDVAIVISPETGDEVREAVGTGEHLGIDASFIVQQEPNGLAAALGLALPWVGGDPCVMYLGDNLVKGGVADIVQDFERHGPNCQIMLAHVEHPEQFGVADVDEAGAIRRLIEKPANPPSSLALVGVYLFDDTIGEAVHAIEPSRRGEYEITDAIQYLIDKGLEVRASVVSGWWKDTGKKRDLLDANELILQGLEKRIDGEVVGTTIAGPVSVEADSKLVGSEVTGPVVIGRGVLIENTVIGPNTAIGDGCRLSDCAVRGSIIMEGTEIHDWRLRNSVIGRSTRIHGPAPEGYVSVTMGEHSEIGSR